MEVVLLKVFVLVLLCEFVDILVGLLECVVIWVVVVVEYGIVDV